VDNVNESIEKFIKSVDKVNGLVDINIGSVDFVHESVDKVNESIEKFIKSVDKVNELDIDSKTAILINTS
jgi:uncharacterized protein YggL (DUF469 family)